MLAVLLASQMVRRFGAELRRADESYVSALSLMAPVFELPLSDVVVVDGHKAVLECRVAAAPAAEVTWYVDNVEIRLTDDYQVISEYRHTHTHTHPFNGPLSGTTQVSRYQKGRVRVLIQRYNSVLFHETFPAEDEIDT